MRTANHGAGERIGSNDSVHMRPLLHRTAGAFELLRRGVLVLPLLLAACQTTGKDTIAQLRNRQIEIREEKIDDPLVKAMESYQRFLDESPDSALKPEALRRLADLKVEREYDLQPGAAAAERPGPAAALPAPERAAPRDGAPMLSAVPPPAMNRAGEAEADFENRAARTPLPAYARAAQGLVAGVDDLERVGALEAITLYEKALKEYPSYERSDQVLYQLARAYEELGRVDEAVQVMGRLAREHPASRYFDEVQFRRAEYFFTRRRFADAEEAYGSIAAKGASSSFFQLALYKRGWSFYKQERYDNALDQFIALLDHKASMGHDVARTGDEAERKRMDDTFRVISLSFSNLGGAGSLSEYFNRQGKRRYEDAVYSNLAEFYFEKRRYSDAAATCSAFIDAYPFHAESPRFQMRVIEIHLAGGFPSLVIDAKRRFAGAYGLKAAYWRHFEPAMRPDVLAWLETNLTDLAKHYHALYQSPKLIKEKDANFEAALQWYRELLGSFPEDPDTPAAHYMLADLYLENQSFDRAAIEYETTAYAYPRHGKSSQAGYAAVYAWRRHLAGAAPEAKLQATKEAVRSSLKFAGSYPEHEKAAIVLGAATDDLYDMRDYISAASAAAALISNFSRVDGEVLRRAWLVASHSNYELRRYREAERAYTKLLELLPSGDKSRPALTDNLAASIYKQGEEANAQGLYMAAAAHFLRVGSAAPACSIRVNAEYDGASALIAARDWMAAATVLKRFRSLFPGHALQPEVTGKLAYVYREWGELTLAAEEYERMERESADEALRREALLTAAELHEKAGGLARALAAYRRYAVLFPRPLEQNLEARERTAGLLKKDDQDGYLAELRQIVALEAAAGSERTPLTRSIAAQAALVLAEPAFGRFAEVKLAAPFEANLGRKQQLMKAAIQQFNELIEYEVGDVTAAAAFYLAEIYALFSRDLKESERPAGLSALEREEYDLAIEEQAYPFEEKAIATHQSNLELVALGVYNEWTDKSLRKLAALLPARYDKQEEASLIITTPESYAYAIVLPGPPSPQSAQAEPDQGPRTAGAGEAVQAEEVKRGADKTDGKGTPR